MRKWLMRLSTIAIVVLLLNSQQGLIDSISNFMIDGVVPFTNLAISGFLSVITIIIGAYLIYKSVMSLRFDMLKRSAILYNQQRQANLVTNNTSTTNRQIIVQAEELELAQTSL